MQALSSRFSALFAVDGSTLDALFRKLKALREQPYTSLGGHMVVGNDLLTKLPLKVLWSDDAAANDKALLPGVLEWLCEHPNCLVVFDMGYFSFSFFDDLTDARC
jgi:hypothetical protein